MQIGAKKLELNKWQFRMVLEKCPPWMDGFAPRFLLQVTKFTKKPPEGAVLQAGDYKGFIWEYILPTYKWVIEVRWVKLSRYKYPYKLRFIKDNHFT